MDKTSKKGILFYRRCRFLGLCWITNLCFCQWLWGGLNGTADSASWPLSFAPDHTEPSGTQNPAASPTAYCHQCHPPPSQINTAKAGLESAWALTELYINKTQQNQQLVFLLFCLQNKFKLTVSYLRQRMICFVCRLCFSGQKGHPLLCHGLHVQ